MASAMLWIVMPGQGWALPASSLLLDEACAVDMPFWARDDDRSTMPNLQIDALRSS
jgi:hypothetical protein